MRTRRARGFDVLEGFAGAIEDTRNRELAAALERERELELRYAAVVDELERLQRRYRSALDRIAALERENRYAGDELEGEA